MGHTEHSHWTHLGHLTSLIISGMHRAPIGASGPYQQHHNVARWGSRTLSNWWNTFILSPLTTCSHTWDRDATTASDMQARFRLCRTERAWWQEQHSIACCSRTPRDSYRVLALLLVLWDVVKVLVPNVLHVVGVVPPAQCTYGYLHTGTMLQEKQSRRKSDARRQVEFPCAPWVEDALPDGVAAGGGAHQLLLGRAYDAGSLGVLLRVLFMGCRRQHINSVAPSGNITCHPAPHSKEAPGYTAAHNTVLTDRCTLLATTSRGLC